MAKSTKDLFKLKEKFQRQLHPQQLQHLYEYLPDVFFFAKNKAEQFVMGNHLFIEKCNVKNESDIIGKTDYDFFPKERAGMYVKDDQEVMRTGKPIINKVELAPEQDNSINWFVTSKVPIYSKDKEIIGLAGIARDMKLAMSSLTPYQDMSTVLEYIRDKYDEKISISQLAKIMNLSVSQFERKFKKTFQTSPIKHIMKVRINAASLALRSTDKKITTIALEAGFYDHSHLTREFVKQIGMSPSQYRKKY